MKVYIIKPKSHKVELGLIEKLSKCYNDAITQTKDLDKADRAILQKGWTRSKNAVAEYHLAKELKIPCREAYLFDSFKVRLN